MNGAFFFAPILDLLLRMSVEGMVTAMGAIATVWQTAPMELREGAVHSGQDSLRPLVLILMVASVVAGGARMAWDADGESGRRLLRSLLTASIVTGGSAAIVVMAVSASDALAMALCPTDEIERLATMMQRSATTELTAVGIKFVVLIVTTFVALSSLIQTVILFLRSAGLIALAVVLPAAAAFTNTDLGRSWFQKSCVWIIALVLYKPAAALLYRIALTLMTSAESSGASRAAAGGATSEFDLYGFLLGVTMMLLAILALPMLIRLITPAVGVVAGGGLALRPPPVGAVPTGAASVGGSRAPVSGWSATPPAVSGSHGLHAASGATSGLPPSPGRSASSGTASGGATSGGGAANAASGGAMSGGAAAGGAAVAGASAGVAASGGAAAAGATAASGGTLAAVSAAGAVTTWTGQAVSDLAQAAGHSATTSGPEGSAG